MLILQFAGGRSQSMDSPKLILKHISPRPILKHFATLIHILADPIHHFWSFGRYFPTIIIGHFSIDPLHLSYAQTVFSFIVVYMI